MKKLYILIPAYNEEATIASVIKSIPKFQNLEKNIVVIDDGSNDSTLLKAKNAGVTVLSNTHNLGLGSTFKKGMEHAISKGADIIVILDGDGQYQSVHLSELITPLIKNNVDLAIGNRFYHNYGSTVLKKIVNKLISIIISQILLRADIVHDIQSSYRGFNRKLGLFLLKELKGEYNYSQEMFILAYLNNFKIKQVPVKCHERLNGSSRLIKNPIIHIYKIFKISLITYFQQKFLK
ncbi:MAG: glycosyltransferase family 2 protein [Promethearchaeota archaeon]